MSSYLVLVDTVWEIGEAHEASFTVVHTSCHFLWVFRLLCVFDSQSDVNTHSWLHFKLPIFYTIIYIRHIMVIYYIYTWWCQPNYIIITCMLKVLTSSGMQGCIIVCICDGYFPWGNTWYEPPWMLSLAGFLAGLFTGGSPLKWGNNLESRSWKAVGSEPLANRLPTNTITTSLTLCGHWSTSTGDGLIISPMMCASTRIKDIISSFRS